MEELERRPESSMSASSLTGVEQSEHRALDAPVQDRNDLSVAHTSLRQMTILRPKMEKWKQEIVGLMGHENLDDTVREFK